MMRYFAGRVVDYQHSRIFRILPELPREHSRIFRILPELPREHSRIFRILPELPTFANLQNLAGATKGTFANLPNLRVPCRQLRGLHHRSIVPWSRRIRTRNGPQAWYPRTVPLTTHHSKEGANTTLALQQGEVQACASRLIASTGEPPMTYFAQRTRQRWDYASKRRHPNMMRRC
jgi:hypothetical protein